MIIDGKNRYREINSSEILLYKSEIKYSIDTPIRVHGKYSSFVFRDAIETSIYARLRS